MVCESENLRISIISCLHIVSESKKPQILILISTLFHHPFFRPESANGFVISLWGRPLYLALDLIGNTEAVSLLPQAGLLDGVDGVPEFLKCHKLGIWATNMWDVNLSNHQTKKRVKWGHQTAGFPKKRATRDSPEIDGFFDGKSSAKCIWIGDDPDPFPTSHVFPPKWALKNTLRFIGSHGEEVFNSPELLRMIIAHL